MKHLKSTLFALALAGCALTPTHAQTHASDSVMGHAGGRRLSVGGYGEAVFSRNFYSDNVYRYSDAGKYADDPSHGRFDIPHAVIYLGYDFGKGWSVGTEIEFEHGGSGSAVEKEYEEGGEWETEVEKGGEVELEQFWIQKSFSRAFNLRAGHIVVPVGLTNAHHEPLNFFGVYRPEGERTILPSTWHETGVSLWGRIGAWRYEAQLLAGLDAFMFNRDNWIQQGAHSPYEFKVANKYGIAARIDNYSLPGLRIGVSGYYGQSMHNAFPHDLEGKGKKYENTKGRVLIGAVDMTFDRYNWIVRGSVDYGYVGDAVDISTIKRNLSANTAPYQKSPVGKNAIATGIEAGYDLFSQIARLHRANQKLYVFGRYDYYNSYIPTKTQQKYEYTSRQCFTAGVNYHPLPQVAIKADYSYRKLKSQYNNEPSLNIGVVYEGFFL